MTAQIAILMGSPSDHEIMKGCKEVIESFGVETEYQVRSAHRAPNAVAEFSRSARERGIKVIIAAAGGAAHLAGAVAANTSLPVIGVPLDSSPLQGLDALLSTVQMPGGVPVATVSIGKWGAKNAGLLALQILGVSDSKIASKLDAYKQDEERKNLSAKLDK